METEPNTILINLLHAHLPHRSSEVAIFQKEQSFTYHELCQMIDQLTENILQIGFPAGSRICICFGNTYEFIVAYIAVLQATCIPVLVSPNTSVGAINYILKNSISIGFIGLWKVFEKLSFDRIPTQIVITDDFNAIKDYNKSIQCYSFSQCCQEKKNKNISEVFQNSINFPANISKIASIIYTSGTTGEPKGVMLSAKNLLFAVDTIIFHLKLSPADTCLTTMSFAQCAGLLNFLAHIRSGALIVTGENPTFLGPSLRTLKERHVSVLSGVPSLFILLLKHPFQKITPYVKNIRTVELSSASTNIGLIQKIRKTFLSATLYNTYGLTEAPRTTYIKIPPLDHMRLLSVGRTTDNVTITIVDSNNRQCEPFAKGEIVIKGPNIALGYWNKKQATKSVFKTSGFRSGDIGYIDQEGYLFIVGRNDDIFKIGAEKVSPYEIENVISMYPGIHDTLVYKREDEIYGNIIEARVVSTDLNITEQELLSYCHQKLEKIKIPSRIKFCEKISIEYSGKPIRKNTVK